MREPASRYSRSVKKCPKPVALPIIFIPGIMGTRLKRSGPDGKTVWDPDSSAWGVATAYKGPIGKRTALVGPSSAAGFNPNYLEIDYIPKLIASNPGYLVGGYYKVNTVMLYPANLNRERIRRGWGALPHSYYVDFMNWLDETAGTHKAVKIPENCESLHYEVWAHPYNWTNDNIAEGEKLGKTVNKAISETKKKYEGTNIRVLKPVIITHSMGGFVSRAYTQLKGGSDKIHGVLHGAMPTDGAPAAYKRMVAGFEGIHSLALGYDQQEVTATAGNMPGALALLPNHRHRDINGGTAWLRAKGKSGKTLWAQPNGYPYLQIYLNQSDWWRLIYKEYLNPRGNEDAAYKSYMKSLNKAMRLHYDLEKSSNSGFHKNTRMFYCADNDFKAWDRIEWRQTAEHDIPPTGTRRRNNHLGAVSWIVDDDTVRYDPSIPQTRFEIQEKNAPGDGTVHKGSGIFTHGTMSEEIGKGFDHAEAFNSVLARQYVANWLFDMVEEQLSLSV